MLLAAVAADLQQQRRTLGRTTAADALAVDVGSKRTALAGQHRL
jgi:hypothetical protein